MLPGSRTLHLSSTVAPKVTSAARTMVKGGTIVAKPFATSATPFVRHYPASIAFGQHDAILNPPDKDRTSTVRAVHSKTAVTVQTAGTVHKTPVPYHPEAPRNRVKNDPKRRPPPFASTLSFEMGPFNKSLHPYRTVASAAFAPSAVPMGERLGSTNPAVSKEIAGRLHKRLYAS
jgi:hypothetical protein